MLTRPSWFGDVCGGKKSQVFVPRRGGVGKENVENFCLLSRQNVQFLAKAYKFLAKMY